MTEPRDDGPCCTTCERYDGGNCSVLQFFHATFGEDFIVPECDKRVEVAPQSHYETLPDVPPDQLPEVQV